MLVPLDGPLPQPPMPLLELWKVIGAPSCWSLPQPRLEDFNKREGVSPSFHLVSHQCFPPAASNSASWQGSLGNTIHGIPVTSDRALYRMERTVLGTNRPRTSTWKNYRCVLCRKNNPISFTSTYFFILTKTISVHWRKIRNYRQAIEHKKNFHSPTYSEIIINNILVSISLFFSLKKRLLLYIRFVTYCTQFFKNVYL